MGKKQHSELLYVSNTKTNYNQMIFVFIVSRIFWNQKSYVLLQDPQEDGGGDHRLDLEQLQQENLLQTPPTPKRHWSHQGVLPAPAPEEDPTPFILDLKNFPELANADTSSQNPNIQVGTTCGEQKANTPARLPGSSFFLSSWFESGNVSGFLAQDPQPWGS